MERRIGRRYRVQPGTFAVLRSTSIELSKIKDMSMGEIAFAVIKSKPIKMGQIINISRYFKRRISVSLYRSSWRIKWPV
jgi:hypothetical protein